MEFEIFTDGSCIRKIGQEIKAGIGIHFATPEIKLKDISEPFNEHPLTNQRAELYAIFIALSFLTRCFLIKKIVVFTDCEYCINKCAYNEAELNGRSDVAKI